MSTDLKNKFKELVPKALKNDTSSITELIQLTQSSLFKFCFLLGRNKEEAQDLCQEVYIKAFTKLNQLHETERFQGWLFQIAKNLFLDQKRTQALDKEYQKNHFLSEADNSQQEQWEAILTLQKILSQFETEDKMILIMIELKGFTYQETAVVLNTTEDAIRLRIHRLRKILQN